jgi:uncharacterized protein
MSQYPSVHSVKRQGDSPCVRNCCLDENDICMGCFRTLDEILAWRALTTKEREQIMIEIEKRRIAKAR